MIKEKNIHNNTDYIFFI